MRGLAPVLGPKVRILILGSMPGTRSLSEQRYYAHPRNALWPIIEHLTGIPVDAEYSTRIRALPDHGIGLWDVLAECVRPGSLDQHIRSDSVRVNDFGAVFDRCPRIECIAFNGQKAATLFERHVQDHRVPKVREVKRVTLPSTSPAHAAMTVAEKCAAWADALSGYLSRLAS